MLIDLTEKERQLAVETVESSTYQGKYAHFVVALLTKLRNPVVSNEDPCVPEDED